MIKPLIYNSDIQEIKKNMEKRNLTPDELNLVNHEGKIEQKIQFAGKRLFEDLGEELEMRKIGSLLFFQIDNGNNYSTEGGKIKKWQTGTIAAISDTAILVYSTKKKLGKAWFCEFKRIGTEEQICGHTRNKSGLLIYNRFQKQLKMQQRLTNMGFHAHITNNMIYCEKVICKEIMDFIN